MYGFSYAGATQLLPATLRPPSLVTVCPALTASQYYEGWTYNQGALALAFAMSWAVSLAELRPGAPRTTRRWRVCRRPTPTRRGGTGICRWPSSRRSPGSTASYFFDWLAHPTYDDYWRRWSIDEDYSRLTVPALHIGGWYDIFLSGSVKNFVGHADCRRVGRGARPARS